MCRDGDDGADALREMSKRCSQLLHHFCASYINVAVIVSLAHSLTRLSRFSGAHCMHVTGDVYHFFLDVTLDWLCRLSTKTQDLCRFVQTLNYDMYWHFSRLYYADNFYSNPQNDYGEDTILHILAVPHVDGSSIEGLEPVVVPPA